MSIFEWMFTLGFVGLTIVAAAVFVWLLWQALRMGDWIVTLILVLLALTLIGIIGDSVAN